MRIDISRAAQNEMVNPQIRFNLRTETDPVSETLCLFFLLRNTHTSKTVQTSSPPPSKASYSLGRGVLFGG
jgi:hypothetical protein